MPHFKDKAGGLHFLDNIADAPALLPAGYVEITDAEADAIRAANRVSTDGPIGPPAVVSPRQIRQALTRANLRVMVEAAIAAGDQDVKDWWEFATQFERIHPMVVTMGEALGQTDAQMDALWTLAGSL